MTSLPDPSRAAAQIRARCKNPPRLAMVLGSGFNHVLTAMEVTTEIPYARLRGFPPVGVQGHAGNLIIGKLAGVPVLVLSGRAHYYEGHDMTQVTFAVRVLAELEVRSLLLTNAAGGINPRFRVGDFMLLTDHINFMGVNPLRGAPVPGRERFVDLTQTYNPKLGKLLRQAANQSGTKLRSGVYLAASGPSYETPAEIRAFRTMGADAVGMSTVPEAIVARQCGMQVAGLSCITNAAAGFGKGTLSHHEVLETTRRIQSLAGELLENFARIYAENHSE